MATPVSVKATPAVRTQKVIEDRVASSLANKLRPWFRGVGAAVLAAGATVYYYREELLTEQSAFGRTVKEYLGPHFLLDKPDGAVQVGSDGAAACEDHVEADPAQPHVSFNAELRRRVAQSWNSGLDALHASLLGLFGKKPTH